MQAGSAAPGAYCGGEPFNVCGLPIDVDAECKQLHGPDAVATTVSPDAYGWVCQIPGEPSQGIDMQAAAQHEHGDQAIAVLVGIGVNDWRALLPQDVGGHVVPVLLLPVEFLDVSHGSFVSTTLARLQTLMGGVRRFYRERTSAAVRGTNSFVLLTNTSATEWQDLSIATDHEIGGLPLDRYLLLNRATQELANGRWNVLTANTSVRIGAFTTLGPAYPEEPCWMGAASDGPCFVLPPSCSYAVCSSTATNPPPYENGVS